MGDRPSRLSECASPKREVESVGSFCLSISLRRKALSWVKARLAQIRDPRLSEDSMDDGLCLNSPLRGGTLVLGEGWSRPSEKELAQARVRELLLCNVLAHASELSLSEIGLGVWTKAFSLNKEEYNGVFQGNR